MCVSETWTCSTVSAKPDKSYKTKETQNKKPGKVPGFLFSQRKKVSYPLYI